MSNYKHQKIIKYNLRKIKNMKNKRKVRIEDKIRKKKIRNE